MNPPTWKSAFVKAAFGAVMLFALMAFGVLGGDDVQHEPDASGRVRSRSPPTHR